MLVFSKLGVPVRRENRRHNFPGVSCHAFISHLLSLATSHFMAQSSLTVNLKQKCICGDIFLPSETASYSSMMSDRLTQTTFSSTQTMDDCSPPTGQPRSRSTCLQKLLQPSSAVHETQSSLLPFCGSMNVHPHPL